MISIFHSIKMHCYRWTSVAMTTNVKRRAIFTSLIVGTILGFINHGDAILEGSITTSQATRILITYIVPYIVSTSSSVMAVLDAQTVVNETHKNT